MKNNDIFISITIIVLFFIGFLAVDIFIFRDNTKKEDINTDVIVTPDVDRPDQSEIKNDINLLSTSNLLLKSYTPSQNVYTTDYKKDIIQLSLNGKFKIAKLEVEGEVFGEGMHFMSFNFESVSGVLNASKKTANQLDLKETKSLGGVFVKSVPVKFIIDLKGNTILAKTSEEFQKKESGSKEVVFWDHFDLSIPTVVKFLIAPFNEYGQYGGAKITSVKFKYLCEDGEDCGAKYCPNSQMTTQCLFNSFGSDAAKNWCERAKVKGCEDI